MEWKTISLTFLSLGVELNLLWNIYTHCIVESVGLPSLCHCVVDVGPVSVSDDGYDGDYRDQLLSRDVHIQNIWAIKIQWVKLKEFLNGDASVNDDDDFISEDKIFTSMGQKFYLNGSNSMSS